MKSTAEIIDVTPKQIFELLAALVEEHGYDEVKKTIDSMWSFLSYLENGDEW